MCVRVQVYDMKATCLVWSFPETLHCQQSPGDCCPSFSGTLPSNLSNPERAPTGVELCVLRPQFIVILPDTSYMHAGDALYVCIRLPFLASTACQQQADAQTNKGKMHLKTAARIVPFTTWLICQAPCQNGRIIPESVHQEAACQQTSCKFQSVVCYNTC